MPWGKREIKKRDKEVEQDRGKTEKENNR